MTVDATNIGFQLQVESELTELPSEERVEFLTSLGVDESGLGNLIRATYNLLGLRTYFTSGEKVWKLISFLISYFWIFYLLKEFFYCFRRKLKHGPYKQVYFYSYFMKFEGTKSV